MPESAANTTVMLLAAGEGRRMLPLTRSTPKPLLKVGQYSLIEHHLRRLHLLGFRHVVINIAYLAQKIQHQLGDGSQFNLKIDYSDESHTGALETAGGIVNALPTLESDPFLVVNADIWTDFDFSSLLQPMSGKGRLVLVPNPDHHPEGDFCVADNGALHLKNHASSNSYTFSGIALYRKSIFAGLGNGKRPLAPILRAHIQNNELDAVIHRGLWTDVGTPERLNEINRRQLKSAP